MALVHFLLLSVNILPLINAFNPLFVANITQANGTTHESMTRCAVATVTGEYIQSRFGINSITVPNVADGSCPSTIFTQIKNAFKQIKSQTDTSYNDWENNLNNMVDANEYVDVLEQLDTSRHFDSESFIAASQVILDRYQSAVDAITAQNFYDANEFFGKTTHTLQDFYSHSTWIELGNRQPQTELGLSAMTPAEFAGPTVRTCTDCATGPAAVCQSNYDTSQGLTSGYFDFLVDFPPSKPLGKCSHGGSADGTRKEDAVGGINKDSRSSIHGYLHNDAAQTAYSGPLGNHIINGRGAGNIAKGYMRNHN